MWDVGCFPAAFPNAMTRTPAPCACLALLLWFCGAAGARSQSLSWWSPELRRLEDERRELAGALATLPPAPAPALTERLGYHSGYGASAETVEWIEIDLGIEETIETIVLVPAASDGGGAAISGYGFPLRWRLELADEAEPDMRIVIADFTRSDFPNPGALPVQVSCGGARARQVRLTATRLYRDGDRALLALGEMLVLQGQRNLAASLGSAQLTAGRTTAAPPRWDLVNLIDGQSVLGPPEGALRSATLGFRSETVPSGAARTPWVQVDLGSVVPVDEVRLFPAHPADLAHRAGYGFPVEVKVEVALEESFGEAVKLLPPSESEAMTKREPVSRGTEVVTFTGRGLAARYVRVTAERPFAVGGAQVLALAEMQVWSGDENVALRQPVAALDAEESAGWSRAALVDGFTSRAEIRDWPEWLRGLSLRRETVQRLAAIEKRQAALVAWWRTLGWWLLGAAVVAALLALLALYLRQRAARRREIEALRLRISQDLHDEIGSSLGSIALISDDALALAKDEALRRELGEIRTTAQQTLDSLRDLVRIVQSGKYGEGDLTGHLRDIAARLLRGVPHTFSAEAAPAFDRLPMQERRDLVLMYKEVLHNLARHAQASHAEITLAQSNGSLTLTVHDDGRGFDPTASQSAGMGLTNIQRRAARHSGTVRIDSAPARGTTVAISLPHHA
jgi:signal transduction histidine kinase